MTGFFVRHPVATWMIFTAFIVLGLYSVPRLNIEAIPEVALPKLTVVTGWNGASPEAVQRSITLPVEAAARQLHGVESVVSRSQSGRSIVEVEFRRNVDMDFARLEMSEQLGAVRRDLPQGASQPQVQAFVPEEFQTEDFFTVNLESSLSTNELRERAETWVLPQILSLEGVADASVQGGALPIIKILLDRRLLDLYRIEPQTVFNRINELDDLAGAGVVQRSGLELTVSLRDPLSVRRLENAIVAYSGGRAFELDELGTIEQSFQDPLYFVRANGKNVVQIAVEKRSGANSVEVSRTLRSTLPEIEADLPFDVSFYIEADEGEELEGKLNELVTRSLAILGLLLLLLALSLKEWLLATTILGSSAIGLGVWELLRRTTEAAPSLTLILAAFVVVGLILVSLRQMRLTVMVVASIAFAIVISLSLFYFFDISVNFITISGLTVSFGLILDNSILVLDAIHRRVETWQKSRVEGLSRASKIQIAMHAVVGGTREVTFPIMATTQTTVVAFASFIFLSGRLSLYYVPLAVSVAMAMLASLFVAFGWLPVVLNQRWARSVARTTRDGDREVRPDELEGLTESLPDLSAPPRGTEGFLFKLQKTWPIFVPLLLGLFAYSGYVYDKKIIKGGFWRMPAQEELFMWMELADGTDVEVVSETLKLFEEPLEPIPEGARMFSRTFGNGGFLRVEFEEELLSTHYPMYFRELLSEQADKTGGASIFIRGFDQQPYMKGSFGGNSFNSLIKLTGYNSKTLREIADETLSKVDRNRRVRNPQVTTSSGWRSSSQEEAVIRVRRSRLAEHNLGLATVVGHVRRLLGVDTPWRMFVDGEQEEIQMIYEDSEDVQYGDLADRVILSPSGEKVRIGDLIDIRIEQSPGNITRENQRYSMQVNWEYVGTEKMRSSYLKDILGSIDLPYGYTAEEGQRQFFTQEEEEDLTLMVILAAAFIFMVLAALFESASLPFLVMTSLPMALVGVVMLFWVTDSDFDSSARIGLVLLFGIVVNNAILLVSRFRKEAEAILKVKLGGDPAARTSLIPGLRKQIGGSDLGQLPAEERVTLLRRAVARGTRIKLRSILLTTGTTLIGLLPLLLFQDETEGKDIWVNLAMASIGGLASSLVLILLVLPMLYFVAVRMGWDRRIMIGIRSAMAFGVAIGGFEIWRKWRDPFPGEWSLQLPRDLGFDVPLPEWMTELAPFAFVIGLILALAVYRIVSSKMGFRDGLVVGTFYSATAAVAHLLVTKVAMNFFSEEQITALAERSKTLLEQVAAREALTKLIVPETILLFLCGVAMTFILAVLLQKRGHRKSDPDEPVMPSGPPAEAV